MKTFFIYALLLCSYCSKAQLAVNRNFAIGFSSGLVVGSLNTLGPRESVFAAASVGALVGIATENYQKSHRSIYDVRTANWNSLVGGLLSGLIVYHVKNHYWRNKNKKKKLFML